MKSKPRGTDGSLLGSLPWTLGALTVSLLPHVPYLPPWILAAFVSCSIWRFMIEKRRGSLPPGWLRGGLALLAFLGVFATYSSISGVGPGSALLAIMASLKLLETRMRRDQFVLLFISIFLVMSSLLREQYLWSLPYLLGAMGLIMTAWLRMSATTTETPARSFRNSSRLLLYAAPLCLVMWVLFPRISSPFWSVPIDTSQATSGISDTMSPGDISSLSLSNAVAFRVSFADQIPAPRDRYWRGLVLTRFNGRTWSASEPMIGATARDDVEVSGEPINYTVTLEPTRQQWVFALDIPREVSLAGTFMGPQQQLARAQPIDQRVAYAATSYLDFSSSADPSSFYRNWYVRLPESGNARSRELAVELRAAAGSDRAFVDAVLRRFHNEDYYYTLRPPALGNNPVDRFLFETRRGFCEHYASSFAFLMRAAGIPARIVLGYQGGELNPLGDYMIVRQADAHAWTEVWIEDEGWQRVDPTAAVAPERIESGISGAANAAFASAWGLSASADWLAQATLIWDAVNARWNEWILGYGPENQNRFLQWLGMDEPDLQKMALTLIGIVAGLVGLISLLLVWRYRPPPSDRAAVLYRRFARRVGVAPTTGETPLAFAARLRSASTLPAVKLESVIRAYLTARYEPSDPAALDRLASAIAALPRR